MAFDSSQIGCENLAQKNRPSVGRLFAHLSACSERLPLCAPSGPTVALAANNRYEVGKDAKANQGAQLGGHHRTVLCFSEQFERRIDLLCEWCNKQSAQTKALILGQVA
jgi:hypothetical protein